jgi:hypothetical protein
MTDIPLRDSQRLIDASAHDAKFRKCRAPVVRSGRDRARKPLNANSSTRIARVACAGRGQARRDKKRGQAHRWITSRVGSKMREHQRSANCVQRGGNWPPLKQEVSELRLIMCA